MLRPGFAAKATLLVACAACSLLVLSRAARADFSFVHVTDTHVTASAIPGSAAHNDLLRFQEIAALKPAFVVNTGDVCEAGTPAEYKMYREIRDAGLGKIRAYVAPGNHDVRWNPTGKEGFTLGAQQPLHQSWDKDNVHFILLDSTVLLEHWGHFNQSELAWLAADLKKTGTNKPVIIGFHHGVGREGSKVDNESAFFSTIAQYNVRLLLLGHGHSDLVWNVNGIPAIMAKGLYQGSFHVIKVGRTKLEVFRRSEQAPLSKTPLFSENLARPGSPARSISINVQNGAATVQLSRETVRGLPEGSRVTYQLDNTGDEQPLDVDTASAGWIKTFRLQNVAAGEHEIVVTATLPGSEKRYLTPLNFTLVRGTPVGNRLDPWLWKTQVQGSIQGKITRSGDTLYVPTMEGDLVALRTADGTEKWRFKTDGAIFSAPLIANGLVVFGSADHNVYAVSADSGKLAWKTATGGAVFAGAGIVKDTLCIGSTDTKIYALNAQTGAIVWTAQGNGMYQSQTASDANRFYIGGWDNAFRCLDAATGAEVWKNTFGKNFYYAPAIGSPAVAPDRNLVLVSSNDGILHAMQTGDGKVVWEVPGPSLGYSGPLVSGDRVYQASLTPTGRVFSFDLATGRALWDTPTGAEIYDSSCAISGGANPLVFIGSVSGLVSGLDATTGAIRIQYHLQPGHLLSSPVVDEKAVYIGSMNGTVTAIPLPGSRPR